MLGILFLFLFSGLAAQFYEYGQDAGSLRWYKFDTPHYHVIYPEGIDSLANAFAYRLESAYSFLGRSLDHEHSPMPVIIHNESSFSNGVFVWAPKRLEIFTNPNPNSYNQDWLWQLALHEGRHAVQIDKLDQGFTRVLHYLGGEQLVGAMAVFLPYWYLEGDAVDTETRLSLSGRGRQPSFEMELKAQMLEGGRIFSFSKAGLGSYKHYIPNHYKLGYLMVRHGRRNYGDRFWIDFQQYAARKPFLLNPTYFSMRNYGLKSKKQFYKNALVEYRDHWAGRDSLKILSSFDRWGQQGKHYTSYRFPHPISESLVFAYKNGLDQIPEFVLLGRNGEEQSLFSPGFLSSGIISYSGSQIVWDEFVPDIRWSNRNYSVIRRYDLATGMVSNLGRKTRFYSPALSHDAARIVAIEQSERQEYSLVILDLEGEVLSKIPSPGNTFIQHPTWMEGDSALVLIRSAGTRKTLVSYHPDKGSWTSLFDAGLDDISHPVVSGEKIFFSGSFSGIDNIYCLDLEEEATFQLTSSRFGAFEPRISAEGKLLFYSNYTAAGYEVASLPLKEAMWLSLEESRDHHEQLDYLPGVLEQGALTEIAVLDTTSYRAERYSKIGHLFNVHSWLPLYVDYLRPSLSLDPEHLPASLGLSLISQNHLSTAVSQVGYEYKNGFHMFHSGIQLKGRYPVLNMYFNYGGEPDLLLLRNEADTAMALPRDIGFTAQTYIPFRFNTGKFLSLFQPRIDYIYRRDLQYIVEESAYRRGVHYLYYSLYATVYLRQGMRDILPRLGITGTAGFYQAPFGNRVYGGISLFGLTAYIPGVLKHHTVRVFVQAQKQYPLESYPLAFRNLMSLPRGRYGIYGEKLNSYSADYVFPILYPDLELSALLYMKRIRGAVWFDYLAGTNVRTQNSSTLYENRNYQSLGLDLLADINFFRMPFPVSLGGRFIYEMDTGRSYVELLYSIDIN